MKRTLQMLTLAAAMLAPAAFAQESSHCYKPVPDSSIRTTDVCEFDSGRVNVTEYIGTDTISTWYTPEEWSTTGPVLRAGWAEYNKTLVARFASPKEKCEAKGGNWKTTRFTKCQMPKGGR